MVDVLVPRPVIPSPPRVSQTAVSATSASTPPPRMLSQLNSERYHGSDLAVNVLATATGPAEARGDIGVSPGGVGMKRSDMNDAMSAAARNVIGLRSDHLGAPAGEQAGARGGGGDGLAGAGASVSTGVNVGGSPYDVGGGLRYGGPGTSPYGGGT